LPDIRSRHVGHRHLSGEYFHAHRHEDTSYGALHSRSSSFDGSAQTHLTANTWDTHPAPTPYPAPTQLRVPSPSALFNAFGHYPPTGATRRVPQMFKLATGRKKHSGKKQPMACLFCRERKIGCLRPPEDEPDQTCKYVRSDDRLSIESNGTLLN
jgi:hypothetical protein